jgi:hypothetical protein
VLAADESNPTIKKRFDSIKVESTEENRRRYREILFTTEGIEHDGLASVASQFFLWARVAGAGACDLERSGRQSGCRSEDALETLPVKRFSSRLKVCPGNGNG